MKIDWILVKGIVHYLMQPFVNRRFVPRRWDLLGACSGHSTSDSGEEVVFHCENGTLAISALSPAIWRVLVRHEAGPGRHCPDYRSWSVIARSRLPLRTRELDNGRVSIVCEGGKTKGALSADLDLSASTLTFHRDASMLHSDVLAAGHKSGWVHTQKRSPVPEKYVGFGEKTGSFFKNGSRLVMWNTDDRAMSPRSDPIYQSCPVQIALREDGTAHAIFFDNTHYSVLRPGDSGQDPVSSFAAEGGPLCYYVLAGPALKDVSTQLAELTGTYAMPPRWVLGHHHSRWEEVESAERILSIAAEIRKRRIPCDVLYLDIGHMRGYRCFTWNETHFPDPQAIVDSIHAMNFKVVVIADPGIKRDGDYYVYRQGADRSCFCRNRRGKVYHAPVWAGPSAFPDFAREDVRKWWGGLYSLYTQIGVDGYWNDMNEPSVYTPRCTMPDRLVHELDDEGTALEHRTLHNVYGLLMARASYEGLERLRPGRRHFLFTRAAFPGIQRYASSWTGDNRSSWPHYRLSIPMLLNMGLTGQMLVGADIGGFWFHPTRELFVRWMQLGALYPFSRNHTRQGTPPQEVWHFGEEAEAIARGYLELRYSLLPYLYTCLEEACRTGHPLMRPLFMEFPQDPACREVSTAETQFMVGPALLAAPALYPQQAARTVHLPGESGWYDWWSGKAMESPVDREIALSLETLPLFVRGGSIVPSVRPAQTTGQADTGRLELLVFPDTSRSEAAGRLYLDDGESKAYRSGGYSSIRMRAEAGQEENTWLSVHIERDAGALEPALWRHPALSVKVARAPAAPETPEVWVNGERAAHASVCDRWLTVDLPSASLPVEIIIKRG